VAFRKSDILIMRAGAGAGAEVKTVVCNIVGRFCPGILSLLVVSLRHK